MVGLSWRIVAVGLLMAIVLQPVAAVRGASTPPFEPRPWSTEGADPQVAPNAAAWYDGITQYSTVTNCASIIQGFPYQEKGIGTYVGFVANPEIGQPGPNTTYYFHVVVGGLGNSCSGQRAYLEITLPENTALAIDATNRVYCLYDGVPVSPASDCPQSLPPSSYNQGAYQVLSPDAANGYTWPIPQGRLLEVRIPVRSSTVLTSKPFHANIWALDGNSSPWLRPEQNVYVFSNTPVVLYPGPSTIITSTVDLMSYAYIYSYGLGGTAYFELGTDTSYGLFTDPATITAGGTAWLAWENWRNASNQLVVQPDTLYHWRLRFAASNGQTYNGADQTFRTLPDGRVTIGSGTPAGCTEATFVSALASAKEIAFDCGALPVTITLTSAKGIISNLTVDGGNKVTLSSGVAQPHFGVSAGGHLTLTQIALANGQLHLAGFQVGCGGSTYVAGNARLTLNQVRFSNNRADAGGALCVEANGYAEIYASQFVNNATTLGGGGAINNKGAMEMYWSDVSGNSTFTDGGGIYNSGAIDVAWSLIAGNAAGSSSNAAGGGIYNSGTASLTNSTVSGNFAKYGGGMSTSGAGLYLNGVSIASNVADPGSDAGPARFMVAGGLDASSGVSMRNTLLADNWPGNCSAVFSGIAFYLTADSNNLDSADRCKIRGTGDLYNAAARLGPLQNNGGRTRTQALGGGSAAIDAGSNVYCGMWDQRGFSGPPSDIAQRQIDGNRDGVAVCDIGAYEYRPQVFLPIVVKGYAG